MEETSVLRASYDGSIYCLTFLFQYFLGSRPGVIIIKHQFDLKGYPFDI